MTGIKWPEGAEANIDGDYTKWVDGNEYNLEGEGWVNEGWVKSENSWSLDEYRSDGDFKVIERPIETVDPIEIKEVSKPIDPPYVPEVGEWCEALDCGEWIKVKHVFIEEDGAHVVLNLDNLAGFYASRIRPIKNRA